MVASYKVHRCRFVDYHAAAINALAFSPRSSHSSTSTTSTTSNTSSTSNTTNNTPPLLACARSSGNIEIWNVASNWYLERVGSLTIISLDSIQFKLTIYNQSRLSPDPKTSHSKAFAGPIKLNYPILNTCLKMKLTRLQQNSYLLNLVSFRLV